MTAIASEVTGLAAATGTWVIDPAHTTLGFSARHAMVAKVRGEFDEFAGTLTIDGADPARSSAELTIQAASINTKTADRDAHLTSPDFLDVEVYPTITFSSTAVEVRGSDIVVTGDLPIHGVTRPVDISYELVGISQDPWGSTRIGFEGRAKISRKDFGLVWNAALETGGVLVGDEVTLILDVEATKQA
jgi:polyisoprenoid-binding protein YceI